MNANVKNYIKKTIGPYLRDATLEVPTIFTPKTSSYYSTDDSYYTVDEVCQDFGYEVEAFNCLRGDAGEFKKAVDSLVNHRRPTVLYLQFFDKANQSLHNRINSYINAMPNHVKAVFNKVGNIPDENTGINAQKNCVCELTSLINLGCRCGSVKRN